ncbi:MAG: nuclear transport factor 2 family protein [Spongiibacteraceae bacterium]
MSNANNNAQLLSDIHDIKTLKYRYSYGANIIDGQSGDLKAFAALYTSDATFDVGMGIAIGPAAIEAMMKELTTQWHSAMHYMLNPVIDVNGDHATAHFTGLFAFVTKLGEAPVWLSNIYTDTFTRTIEGWRFQSVSVRQTFADPVFLAGYADQLQ